VGSAWRQRLSKLSRILHPWRLVDGRDPMFPVEM
jgi:hypothetical protein